MARKAGNHCARSEHLTRRVRAGPAVTSEGRELRHHWCRAARVHLGRGAPWHPDYSYPSKV